MQKYHDEPKQYKGYLKSALAFDKQFFRGVELPPNQSGLGLADQRLHLRVPRAVVRSTESRQLQFNFTMLDRSRSAETRPAYVTLSRGFTEFNRCPRIVKPRLVSRSSHCSRVPMSFAGLSKFRRSSASVSAVNFSRPG